ncbi:hypothetical protein [Lonepinella sp. MS14436]|uniref:hypothetical protein n=1 Tax=Lonepinella sp. MS14436 TaxID=3003619 RepID=UPI0036D89FD2
MLMKFLLWLAIMVGFLAPAVLLPIYWATAVYAIFILLNLWYIIRIIRNPELTRWEKWDKLTGG